MRYINEFAMYYLTFKREMVSALMSWTGPVAVRDFYGASTFTLAIYLGWYCSVPLHCFSFLANASPVSFPRLSVP